MGTYKGGIMKVLVCGFDGYIGFALTQHLLEKGYQVYGIDNYSRRERVRQVGSNSLIPLLDYADRVTKLSKKYKGKFNYSGKLTLGINSPVYLKHALANIKPDAIYHLAEQPSAPYSMADPLKSSNTQLENVLGTLHLLWAMRAECPEAHLIKIGTMGEYGTPNCDIPEGVIPDDCLGGFSTRYIPSNYPTTAIPPDPLQCPMSGLLFPRTPGSFYHASKVMDTINIEFACRNWNLHSTDIMQGVVFGLNETNDDELLTRFDYDECFGTAINRFCVQSLITHPLTVYGQGDQTRGFLPLKDSIQCLTIALENPPGQGEYRTFNQFENIYSINDLATMVNDVARNMGICSKIKSIPNPRKEAEQHYYNPSHQKLFNLGYNPTTDIENEISILLERLIPYTDRVINAVIEPRTFWT